MVGLTMRIACKYIDEETGEAYECIMGYCKQFYTCDHIGRVRGQSLNVIQEALNYEAKRQRNP